MQATANSLEEFFATLRPRHVIARPTSAMPDNPSLLIADQSNRA
jgi:hypothetical protein